MKKKTTTTCPSDSLHTYIVGINYESPDEDKGHFDIQRKVTIKELAIEVAEYLENGKSSFPAFPPEANPEVWYVWVLDATPEEDGDMYHELMAEIEKLKSLKTAA